MGGAMEKDDAAPESGGAQPLPSYYTSRLLSRFRRNLCFTPLEARAPTWRMPPLCCWLQLLHSAERAVVTTSQASPGHTHPPVGGTGGGRDRVPRLSRSCKGSKPHATGKSADTSPLQQMWKQPVEAFLCEDAAGTGAALASCPRHASCTAQLGTPLVRGDRHALAREGGRAWQRGPKSSTERAEKWTTAPPPQHCTSS